jgi:hypothetical protein
MDLPSKPDDSAGAPSSSSPTSDAFISQTRRQLRAPGAAGIAGIGFAAFFVAALVLVRGGSLSATSDAQLVALYRTEGDLPMLLGALYLAPFAGILFLWFIAVVRDQVGAHEDQFFATVFLGSGLSFVAILFVAAAVAVAPSVGVRYLGLPPPTLGTADLVRELAYTLLFAFGTRAGAVFLFATATISLRSGTFPRWVAWTGYLLGVALLIAVTFWDWSIMVLPAWVAVLSLFILQRERGRRTHGSDVAGANA